MSEYEFFSFCKSVRTSENYENSYSRVKINNVNFRKSVVLWANSGGDVTSEYDVDQNMKVLLKKIMRMRCRDED